METSKRNLNINDQVQFSHGQVPEILKRLENFLQIPISFRSSTGETVVKTNYFFGPCSIIRGTEIGKVRCRKVYANIEEKLFRRKVPIVTFCYAGFLVFAVPLAFRGEMIGTLLGSQILPYELRSKQDIDRHFGPLTKTLKIQNEEEFYSSFAKVRHLDPDFERISFLDLLRKLGDHFIQMAYAGKIWARFYREILADFPLLEKVARRK